MDQTRPGNPNEPLAEGQAEVQGKISKDEFEAQQVSKIKDMEKKPLLTEA